MALLGVVGVVLVVVVICHLFVILGLGGRLGLCSVGKVWVVEEGVLGHGDEVGSVHDLAGVVSRDERRGQVYISPPGRLTGVGGAGERRNAAKLAGRK